MAIEQTPELDRMLEETVDRRASDLILIPGEPMTFRVNGVLRRKEADPLTAEQVKRVAVAAVGDDELKKVRTSTGGVTTSCGLPGVVDGRMTIASAMGDITIVIRILPGTVLSAKDAGLPEALLKAAEAPHGLIVIGGPTGSGKSTAAISLLDHLNAKRPVHIVTIEDPILARLTPKQALIQQREVGTDMPNSLAGLRHALRQDIDVLYLSELRSLDELQAVVTASDIGHLVITVVHGRSPEDIIQRMVDVMSPETRAAFAKRLAGALRAVTCQYLLPRAGGKGRVAAYGVLVPDEETRQAIVEGRNLRERTAPPPAGCRTLAEDIGRLSNEGVVSEEAAAAAAAAIAGLGV